MNYGGRIQHPQTNVLRSKKGASARVRAEVVLGSPNSNCRGVGICRVTASYKGWKEVSPHCKRARAIVGIMHSGCLYFSFLKKSMCDEMVKRHFTENGFCVETAFEIPSFLKSALSIERQSLLPGVYPVMETPSKWIVFF